MIDGSSDTQQADTYVLVYSSAGSDLSGHRSVVMADLNGKSYSCSVQIIDTDLQVHGDPTCSSKDNSERMANEETNTRGAGEIIIAEFPCAPALFGPTHISNLDLENTLTVEAAVQAPVPGEEYGCNQKKTTVLAHDDEQEASEFVCDNHVISVVHRGICTFQEKSVNQKEAANARGVIVINTEDDDLFVMSGGFSKDGVEDADDSDCPVTVLVTGSDGQAILDIIDSFEFNEQSQLHARIAITPDAVEVSESETNTLSITNEFWPGVRASPDALQIFSRSGWAVHALQKPSSSKLAEFEWQLFLMTHDVNEGVDDEDVEESSSS